MPKKNPEFKRTKKVGKDIPVLTFIKSRIVSPKTIINVIKEENRKMSIGEILWYARYMEGKALEGYDFIDMEG